MKWVKDQYGVECTRCAQTRVKRATYALLTRGNGCVHNPTPERTSSDTFGTFDMSLCGSFSVDISYLSSSFIYVFCVPAPILPLSAASRCLWSGVAMHNAVHIDE